MMPADYRSEYDERGVVHLPSFFEPTYAAEMRSMWAPFKASLEAQAGNERNARFVYGVLPDPIGSICRHPKLVALATSILGSDVALYMNRLLLKDATWKGSVTIHQDMPYYHGGLHKLSIFVPLQPSQAHGGNGGLKYLVGSHKYGNLQRGGIDRAQFAPMEEVGPSAEVGDVTIMNFLTWHYSEEAVRADDRPLLQIVYQPSADGSYASARFGVAEPTLIAGEWRTSYFTEWNRGIIPDA
jgi:hypothetical protein